MAESVAVGRVERALVARLRQFNANVVRFTRRTLNDGTKAIRLRMTRERLSGIKYGRNKAPQGAPLARKTGTLIRSINGRPKDQGDTITLFISIGGGAAWYAQQYEDNGRLQFKRICSDEFVRILEELRIGFSFLARSPGQAGVLTPGVAGSGIEDFFAERDLTTFKASRRLTNRGGRGRRARPGANSFQADSKAGFWDRERQIPRSGLLTRAGL